MKKHIVIGLCVTAGLLTGCGGLSGLGGGSSYACKAPNGVACNSVSGNYANAIQHNLPSQRNSQSVSGEKVAIPQPSAVTDIVTSGTPIRSKPKTARVWIAPWEDSDGDLREQSYAYVVVDNGRWLIEHNRRSIAKAYAAKPPVGSNGSNNSQVSSDQHDKDKDSSNGQ